MPLEDFLNQVMRNVVGVLANNIGWHAAQTTAVDILADLAKRYLLQLARATHNYAEHFGRTSSNLNDASLALRDMGVNISELEEYIQNFDPVLLPYSHKVPEIPVKKESKLNFLRPGSEEVLTRAMHVHEYMPPMIFEKKEPKEPEASKEDGEIVELGENGQGEMMDTTTGEGGSNLGKVEEVETVREPSPEKESNNISEASLSNGISNMEVEPERDESSEDEIEALENGGTSSRKFTPFSGLSKTNKRENASENPALKRVRMMLEEEGHPLREISSAMMTSSGFLSSSREGRLPDTRPPPIPREFFEPLPPPPLDKKKKVTMKRIVEGVKKIEKEKENDVEDADEPALFGNPDKIKTSGNKSLPVAADLKPVKDFAVAENDTKGEGDPKKLKKLKKLKLDKKKMSKGLERDKKKLKIFKKAQQMKAAADKALLKKSKKFQLKEFTKSSMKKVPSTAVVQESLDLIDSEDDFDMDTHDNLLTPSRPQPTVAPMIIKSSGVAKKKELFTPTPDGLKISKTKESKSGSPSSSAGLSPHLVSTPKTSPLLEGGFPSKKVSPLSLTSTPAISPDGGGQLKKKRGRPRKNTPLVLTPAALANLGRGLMQEKRQLKIKKSHMEPDVRSLIPEISISTPTPPKANRPPPNLNLLPAAPGLIPTGGGGGFGSSPVKMPTHIPPSISITPATPSILPSSPVKDKNHFGGGSGGLHHGNVCSSITITPIDMPNSQKLPTPYDKTVTPGIGSPSMQQNRPNKPVKEKPSPPTTSMQMPIKGSGITITPIVMKEDRFSNEGTIVLDSKLHKNNLAKMDTNMSGIKLEDDLKAKEQRRKEKERRKELKKEKKKEKKEKEKLKEGKVKEEGKEKKDKKDKSEKKKEKKKDKLVDGGVSAISSPPYGATVPKLTLKLSGHSGTPTPVDSPNPPPVTIDYEPKVVQKVLPPPPPLTPAPKKIVFKPIEDQVKVRTPSPELARFSPLVTRAPKPGRAAKAHAAAAVAAEAMGALMGHQMVSFPPDNAATPGSSKRGRKPGPGGKTEKAEKVPKAKAVPTVTTLVTETVGWFEDEHGNKIWICPSCGRQDDGSPMIGCDICDDWYHFVCVGITETPAEDSQWYCPRCEKKKHKKDRKK